MGLTLTEAFGAGGYSEVGATSGGSTTVVVPPADVAAAGALAICAWMLDMLLQAQRADAAASTLTTISRSISESSGNVIYTYTVRLTCGAADISEGFAENVDDPFSS